MNYLDILAKALNKSKMYERFFDEGSRIEIFHIIPDQDEEVAVGIAKKHGQMVYWIRNYSQTKGQAGIVEVAGLLEGYRLSPEDFAKNFREALAGKIAKSLADEELEGLEAEVLE